MKKYLVLKDYESVLPDVVAQFEKHADATKFASLSAMSDTTHEYAVAQVIATTAATKETESEQ